MTSDDRTLAIDDTTVFVSGPAPASREPTAVIIASDPAARLDAVKAVAYAGGRVLATMDWDSAAATLGDHALIDWILVEAEGVPPNLLEAILARIDTLAHATEARIVAALDFDQIDIVSATLLTGRSTLLCQPTLSDRVVALAVATPTGATHFREETRQAEAERLRRLNEEVARIAETLARLTRNDAALDRSADSVGDRRPAYGAPPAEPNPGISAREIRQAIKSRRLRDQFFDRGLFEDPAWDMLLDLFAAELEDVAVSVSSLCIAAAVAPTTALRWIAKLTDAGLLERRPDPFDKRRAYMSLGEPARTGLNGYCAAVLNAGLAIA